MTTNATASTVASLDAYPENVVDIFWLKKDDTTGGSPKANFNPALDKTIIFVHGWSPGAIATGEVIRNMYSIYPELYKNDPTQVNLVNKWIDAGWNVGVFNWYPFADDDDITDFNAVSVVPYNTESKIHSTDNIVGMRYRNLDGSTFSNLANTSVLYGKTVTEMFLHRYQAFFSKTSSINGIPINTYFSKNKEMRIVGFSLGNQIAMCGTSLINQQIFKGIVTNVPKVTRIELLDPYYCAANTKLAYATKCKAFSNSGGSASIVLQAFKSLPAVIPTVWYQTTPLTNIYNFGDSNDALKKDIVWQGIKVWCVGDVSLSKRHSLAVDWYFNSIDVKYGAYKYSGTWYSGYKWIKLAEDCNAFSACSPNDYVLKKMPLPVYWLQISNSIFCANVSAVDGCETIETNDDCFSMEDGEYASSVNLMEYL